MKFFSFTLVFAYNIFNIQIASIIYLFYFVKNYLFDDSVLTIKYSISLLLFCLFAIWVTISTLVFNLETNYFDFRYLYKYVFIYFFLVLILPIKLNKAKFELLIYRFAILLSAVIVVLFIYFYLFRREFLLDGMLTRLWAVGYIPGWPNSAPVPLLFGLWISFRNKFSLLGKFLIYVAIFMTLARTGLVGAFMITAFYIYAYKLKYIKNLKYPVICLIIFCFALILIYFESELADKFYYTDRLDVFHFTISYIQNRPFLGYGGNTLDQLNHIDTGYTPLFPWSHTHNWILEMFLRYGVVGGSLFFIYIMSVFIKIQSMEKKIMFAVLLFLALFQTFMQEFVYLFFLSYLANEGNNISSKNLR